MKLLCFIAIIYMVQKANSQPQPTSTAILERILGQGYDRNLQPGSTVSPHRPTQVNVNLYVRRLALNGDNLDLEITFRENWNDHRLNYGSVPNAPQFIVAPSTDEKKKIWVPDTFFQNGYDVKKYSTPNANELVRIHSNGDVLLSQRLSIKTICPMSLEYYPRDTQACHLDLASYGHTSDDINYSWKSESPVQLKDGLNRSMAQFLLTNTSTGYCTSKTSTGEYSCLRVTFKFERTYSSEMTFKLHVIPFILVLLSLIPMIINAQSIIVRVVIGFGCLIALILHWSIIGTELPKVSYNTGAQMWLTRCFGFIVATLIQLCFYAWIVRITTAKKERAAKKDNVGSAEPVQNDITIKGRTMGVSLLVDLISLGIFLLALLVFIVHYFAF